MEYKWSWITKGQEAEDREDDATIASLCNQEPHTAHDATTNDSHQERQPKDNNARIKPHNPPKHKGITTTSKHHTPEMMRQNTHTIHICAPPPPPPSPTSRHHHQPLASISATFPPSPSALLHPILTATIKNTTRCTQTKRPCLQHLFCERVFYVCLSVSSL